MGYLSYRSELAENWKSWKHGRDGNSSHDASVSHWEFGLVDSVNALRAVVARKPET
jgi:hypothetical protein